MPVSRPLIPVTVEDVFHFGIFVRLEDGTRGYIRKRELSLAGDLEPRAQILSGQVLQAAIILPARDGRITELSLRPGLPDPWQHIAPQLKAGQLVTGTVKNFLLNGIFVQIHPGLDGFIPLEELSTWPIQHPEDLVWRGDQVEAIVILVDPAGRRLRLSVRRRLEQLQQAQSLVSKLPSIADSPENEAPSEAPAAEAWPPIANIGPILVVEDQQDVRDPLVHWLANLGCTVTGKANAQAALELGAQACFSLILIDLDMPGINGMAYLERLRAGGDNTSVAVMSDPELIAHHLPALQALGVLALFPKPLDLEELHTFLVSFAGGENLHLPGKHTSIALPADLQEYQDLAAIMRSGLPLQDRFAAGLEKLQQETGAEAAAVFQLDPHSGTISVVALQSECPPNMEAAYLLTDSPVKDVIKENLLIWERRAQSEHQPRFRNLLAFLPFEACVGAPITAGWRTRHAVFIFHREAENFSRHRQRDVLAMANFFAAALESYALEEHIQSISGLLLSGQLAAGFGHEVSNKLSSLELQLRNLCSAFDRQPNGDFPDKTTLRRALDAARETTLGMRQTVVSFRHLMETQQIDPVNLGEVLQEMELQLRPIARRADIGIRLDYVAGLPLAAGSRTGLLQIFLNLGLNAIQQMELCPKKLGMLLVSARVVDQAPADPAAPAGGEASRLQIRFVDNGPGIHRREWQNIFALGYTTRPSGSGQGLFIARSLAAAMGGTIRVEESFIPLGTTFLVELLTAR